MNKYLKYVLVAIIGVAFMMLPIGVPMIKTFSDYSMFNRDWNGCSKFAKKIYQNNYKIVPIISPYNTYDFNQKNGVLFIIGPSLDFSDNEVEQVREFLNNGNTIVIADDFGTANQVLEKLNISAKVSKNRVNDMFYYLNDDLIITCRIKNDFGNSITMNVPSYVNLNEGINEGIILTSLVSSSGKKEKAYPIMVETKYSSGKIIIISDPDIFTNGMYEFNNEFLEEFLAYLNSEVYFFDEAHRAGFDPYDLGVMYLHSSVSKNAMFLIFVIVMLVGYLNETGLIKKMLNFKRKQNLNEKMLKKIAENHNIDVEDLKKVITKIKEGRNYG